MTHTDSSSTTARHSLDRWLVTWNGDADLARTGLGLLESSPYQAAALRASAKITAVVREGHRDAVAERLGSIRVIDPVPTAGAATVPLGMLSDAIAARRLVQLTSLSEDPDGSGTTVRDVETMGLLRAGDAWLLAGSCRLRDAVRGFRIDRIGDLVILDEVPEPRDPMLWEADLARWSTRRLGERAGGTPSASARPA